MLRTYCSIYSPRHPKKDIEDNGYVKFKILFNFVSEFTFYLIFDDDKPFFNGVLVFHIF